MIMPYKLTIPETLGDMRDKLGWIMLSSPHFTHDRFPGRNIDTTFTELFAGLDNIRKAVGDECHQALVAMATEMRVLFEADAVREGNVIAYDMQEMIAAASKSRRKKTN